MRWWLYLLAGGICYLFFTLAYLPAQHALYWFAPEDSPLLLNDVSGTVWHGSAQQSFYNGTQLGSADWSFTPLPLLLGRVGYEIDISDKNKHLTGHATLNILTGGYLFSNLAGSMEASILPALIGQPFIGLNGSLDVEVQSIQVTNQQLSSISGRLRWKDATIRKPINLKLGGLEFTLSDTDNRLKTTFKDIGGPTRMEGVIELDPDGKYRFNAKVKPSANSDPGLVTVLKNAGRPLTDGSTQLDYTGQL